MKTEPAEILHPEKTGITVWIVGDKIPAGASDTDCRLISVGMEDWNRELSPWKYSGKGKYDQFSGEADRTLENLTKMIRETEERLGGSGRRYIAGYSLAGLFALYALFRTDLFDGCASCSGSLWFPGWKEFAERESLRRQGIVYLSLGDREERSRNPVWAEVGNNTRRMYEKLKNDPLVSDTVLVMNRGGHFDGPEERLAAGIQWLAEHGQEK